MDRLGLKVLVIVITDPFGGQEKLIVVDKQEYKESIKTMNAEIQDFLDDNNKFLKGGKA